MEWKLPDLGEGVQEGEIVKWLVKEGETISTDQQLVEIMTDKATMELPSPLEGTVEKILVKEGSVAKVGQPLAVIRGGEAVSSVKQEKPAEVVMEVREPVEKAVSLKRVASRPRPSGAKALASPTVRRMAREQGIDLKQIEGSGPAGRVLTKDLEGTVRPVVSLISGVPAAGQPEAPPAKWISYGPEERQPLRGLRRKIAEHMVLSRKTAAHFTHVDEADLTDLVLLREQEKTKAKQAGVRLTYLAYILKAVLEGLKKHPAVNASIDASTQELVLKQYYNLGIAVATPQGLIVPNVKKADQKNLYELAQETTRLGEAARSNKITLEDLKGGTFTITNIGSIGGILSAPIINYPEVAIMGLHQIKPRPMVVDGGIEVRQMMYISVSADHRVMDGADVAQFLRDVILILEKPSEHSKLFS